MPIISERIGEVCGVKFQESGAFTNWMPEFFLKNNFNVMNSIDLAKEKIDEAIPSGLEIQLELNRFAAFHLERFKDFVEERAGSRPEFEEPELEAVIDEVADIWEERLGKLEERYLHGIEVLVPKARMNEMRTVAEIDALAEEAVEKIQNIMDDMGRIAERRLDQARQQSAGITHYIWCSQDDAKVRRSHAVNDDRIFAWDDPPPTGHPGEDFGCRCTAEPVVNQDSQTLVSKINDNSNRWDSWSMVYHAYFGGGVNKTLSEIGHLREVINHYENYHGASTRVTKQVIDEARKFGEGELRYNFRNSYDFSKVEYPHGDSVVKGEFIGTVEETARTLTISGKVKYEFTDEFTDPASVREVLIGTSGPNEVPSWVRFISDAGWTAYSITDCWEKELNTTVEK